MELKLPAETILTATLKQVLADDCQIFVVQTGLYDDANLRALAAERRMEQLSGPNGRRSLHSEKYCPSWSRPFKTLPPTWHNNMCSAITRAPRRRDGSFHVIDLRIKARKDLRVRARRGYYSPNRRTWPRVIGNHLMEQLLTQFLEHLRYERNVSEHTLRNYQSDLEQFVDHLAPAHPKSGKRNLPALTDIDHITIREWLATLHTAQKKKSSIARKLAALRTFFQFLVREGVLEQNPAKLVSTPRLEKKLPKHLSIEDAIKFIETPDTETDLGKRDRAMLELMYATGVRVAELTKLNLGHIDFRNRLIRVTGKRRKERIVPFGEPALDAMKSLSGCPRWVFLTTHRSRSANRKRCF